MVVRRRRTRLVQPGRPMNATARTGTGRASDRAFGRPGLKGDRGSQLGRNGASAAPRHREKSHPRTVAGALLLAESRARKTALGIGRLPRHASTAAVATLATSRCFAIHGSRPAFMRGRAPEAVRLRDACVRKQES